MFTQPQCSPLGYRKCLVGCVEKDLILSLLCRAFHHYRGKKELITKHPELEKLLKEEYRSIDDFRAKDTVTNQKENKSH